MEEKGRRGGEGERVRSYEIQLANDPRPAFTANYRSTVDPFQRGEIDRYWMNEIGGAELDG